MGLFRMVTLAVLAALTLAAPTHAQEEGVFIDPDSPSAKQYSIPFETERRQADPRQEPGAAIVQGARTSPTFGAGIVSGDQGEPGSSSQRRAARSAERGGRAGDGSGTADEPAVAERGGDDEVLQAATANPGPPDGGIGVALAIGGVAVGVLVLGGLAGILLRRRA